MPGNGAQNTNNDTMTMTGRVQPGQSFVKKVFRKVFTHNGHACPTPKALAIPPDNGAKLVTLYCSHSPKAQDLSTSAGSNPMALISSGPFNRSIY